jgi:serine protease AprX
VDGYGHGTHVASLIGSNQPDIKGVAPGVSFVSLRVLDSTGSGLTSNVINAVQWAVANKAAYGIDVLNMSLGHPIFEAAETDPLVQAVEAAVRSGIVVVASAGNFGVNPTTGVVGYGGISSPGNAPSAITVGAVRTFDTTSRADDLVADYSSRGPTWIDGFAKPDIVAPGHALVGAADYTQTLYTLYPLSRTTVGGRPYMKLSGTSMAAAVVSGTVALMIDQAKSSFNAAPPVNAIKAMLQVSALPMTNASGVKYDVLTQGAGALNAAGAVTVALSINPTIPLGSAWLVQTLPTSTTIDGQNIVWGDNIVWGNNIVWGDSYSVLGTNANNIVWGNLTESVLGGLNIVWGNVKEGG